jgi:hypothetical protein
VWRQAANVAHRSWCAEKSIETVYKTSFGAMRPSATPNPYLSSAQSRSAVQAPPAPPPAASPQEYYPSGPPGFVSGGVTPPANGVHVVPPRAGAANNFAGAQQFNGTYALAAQRNGTTAYPAPGGPKQSYAAQAAMQHSYPPLPYSAEGIQPASITAQRQQAQQAQSPAHYMTQASAIASAAAATAAQHASGAGAGASRPPQGQAQKAGTLRCPCGSNHVPYGGGTNNFVRCVRSKLDA